VLVLVVNGGPWTHQRSASKTTAPVNAES